MAACFARPSAGSASTLMSPISPRSMALGTASLFEVKTSILNPKKALGIQLKKTPLDLGITFRLGGGAQDPDRGPGAQCAQRPLADIAPRTRPWNNSRMLWSCRSRTDLISKPARFSG
jgi:hypothetical protein